MREILKEYSKCPSYPQIFVSGLCIPGGLNYLREMAIKGRFLDLFPQTEIIVRSSEKIERLVSKGRYMVFLKGTPTAPLCLDSKKMMDILKQYLRFFEELEHFDLTKDNDILRSLL